MGISYLFTTCSGYIFHSVSSILIFFWEFDNINSIYGSGELITAILERIYL